MTTVVLAVGAFHVAALAGVLLLSKYSAVLVDEDFRPMPAAQGGGAWCEHVVEGHDATVTSTRR